MVTIFKFFIISCLNLSFLGEVQRDRGPRVGTAQHNSHFFLPLQEGFSALCSAVPESSDHWPSCVSSGVLRTDTGRVGFGYAGSGCFQVEHGHAITAPSRRRAVLSDPGTSGETTVPWAAHVLCIGSAGSRDPAQPDHSASVRAHGSPAVSGPGACAKCV